ncbi:hypothetical protein NSK_000808 [Nannochloropsis salina CCMP1776]|uniref:C2 domain-containing protein n=1 Tax=Nannochloropsis salina CCMP1776 TaxID=1027361 RepID=A0A4D9DD48_9STRA|nr:hypothetical protein NSK_000808 [Nannochloropsis salina CCMP1776]|eukprot:TFJ87455.1 hypothetical protein NSK_000808 [Nannochloropsis salina CCMP1776]
MTMSPTQEKPPSKLSDLLKDAVFDVEKAVKTASFAFSVYGAPKINTWYNVQGGTRLGLPQETVRRNFEARLRVTVLRAKDLPKESKLADYILSGSMPDAYALLEVKSKWGYDQGRTITIPDSNAPEWTDPATATSELLVEDLSTATLEVSLRDENRLGKDSVLGQASIPPPEIPAMHSSWTGWLPLKQAEDKLEKGKVELRVETLPAVGAGEGIELSESSANLGTSIPSTNDNGLDSDEEDAEAPRSTEADLDWNAMAAKLTNASLSLRKYRMAVFFTNESTDTQGGIWWRKSTKEVILVFRGTEINSLQDVMTDLNIVQTPLGDGDKRLVHTGFWTAFKSIVDGAYHSLEMAVGKGEDWAKDGWTIDCSGHSLGGALASLMAHNIAHNYPELCRNNRLHMYSFGAPRVGNPAFCEEFNMLLVRREGRERERFFGSLARSIEYDHFGFCVLITDEALKSVSIYLDGQRNQDEAASAPSSNPPSDTATLSPSDETLSSLVGEGVPVSAATAAVDNSKEESKKTTISDMLNVASTNIKTLGGFLQGEPVGPYERMDKGMPAVPVRRGTIPVPLNVAPEVAMGESLLEADVRDHSEISYFEAIQKFAALIVEEQKEEKKQDA